MRANNVVRRWEDWWFHAGEGRYINQMSGDNVSGESLDKLIARRTWPTIDGAISMKPSLAIAHQSQDRYITSFTWMPSQPQIIRHATIIDGQLVNNPDGHTFNHYRAPAPLQGGKAELALPWVEHVLSMYPGNAQYIFDYFAHLAQNPGVKANAILVLCGAQGIGKDTMLVPIYQIVGNNNVQLIAPDDVFSSFTAWQQALLIHISEARPDDKHFSRVAMYNRLKKMAAPPAFISINKKHMQPYMVENVSRVIITLNEIDGIHIEPGDRRMYVAVSDLPKRGLGREHFVRLYRWLNKENGAAHVQQWLMERDISAFDPNTVEETEGWHMIKNQYDAPHDLLESIVDQLKHPPILFTAQLLAASGEFDNEYDLKALIKNGAKLQREMRALGYAPRKPMGKRMYEFKGKRRIQAKYCFVKQDQKVTDEQVEEVGKTWVNG